MSALDNLLNDFAEFLETKAKECPTGLHRWPVRSDVPWMERHLAELCAKCGGYHLKQDDK